MARKTIYFQHVDWTSCLELTRQNPDRALELVHMFAEDLTGLFKELEVALSNQDRSLALLHIHRFLGACCYLRAPKLESLAHIAEKKIVAGDSEEALSALKTELEALNAEIHEVEIDPH